jgi:hypothetical protein
MRWILPVRAAAIRVSESSEGRSRRTIALTKVKDPAGRIPTRWSLAVAAAVLIIVGFAPSACAQGDLPQLDTRIELGASVGEQLRAALSEAGAMLPPKVDPPINGLLISLLPGGFRDSCAKALTIPVGRNVFSTVYWSTRILSIGREGRAVSALLAFRCTSRNTNSNTNEPYYDERPAVLQLGVGTASITFIPLAESCSGCPDLYHVEFVDTIPVEHGSLMKLEVVTSSDSPAFTGIDTYDRAALLWVAIPQAHVALQVDSRTEFHSCDDSTEDCSDEVCSAQVRDGRDGVGHVVEIVTVTTCTQDKVARPSETVRYVWEPAAARFEKAATAKP